MLMRHAGIDDGYVEAHLQLVLDGIAAPASA
jgi:hypothetical protein